MIEAIEGLCLRATSSLASFRIERQVRRALADRNPREIPTHMTSRELHWLYESARRLAPGANIIEIGSYLGASSVYLAAGLGDGGGRLHCVDTWQNEGMLEGPGNTMDRFLSNTAGLSQSITTTRMRSQDALVTMPGPFQLAFVDGDHSYEGVRADLRLLEPRMTPDGILALHDWRFFSGVTTAVLEFIRSTTWKPAGFVDNLIHLKREHP